MFKRILVPLDGSQLSELALPYAEELAGAFNCEVALVFVCDTPHCQHRQEHQAYVEKMAKLVKDHVEESGGEITVKPVVVDGYPAVKIIDYAAENDISLITMATHGRSGIMSWVIGSVANKILRGVNIPILLVRASVPTPKVGKEEKILSRIIVPLDGSEVGEAALPYVSELAKALKAEVTLLQVVATGQHVHTIGGLDYVRFTEQEIQLMEAHAKQYLDEVSKRLSATGATIRSELRFGDPAEEIIKFAGETDTHLVAMSTHGQSAIDRWTFGSVTHKVLHSGNTSLLVVRAQEVKK